MTVEVIGSIRSRPLNQLLTCHGPAIGPYSRVIVLCAHAACEARLVAFYSGSDVKGLVQRPPFSNTRVSTLSDEDALQIFDIRIEFEPLAFELAGRSLRPGDAGHLHELVAHAEEDASAGKLADLFGRHLAFFRIVWELSENKYLRQTLERLVVPLFALYLTRASFECEALMRNAFACPDRQEQILETIQAGDVYEVKRMVSDCRIQMKAIIVRKAGVCE